jgi:hypothetical protein
MRSTKLGCFRLCSWCLWKALSMRRGAWAWFHDVWTCSAKVLNIEWFRHWKIKLNHSWKFWRNWKVPLVLLERFWRAEFNGIYLVRFGFKMWETLIFKGFLPLKIQINSQKPGFGWENQLRTNVVTLWRLTIQFKHDFLSYLAVRKIDTDIAKQCSHVEFPYCCNGFTLEPTAKATLVDIKLTWLPSQ